MWIECLLDDTNITVTLRDDTGASISLTGNPYVFPLDDFSCDPNDKIGDSGNHLIIRSLSTGSSTKGSFPPAASFPRANMVFVDKRTGPRQTENEVITPP